MTIRFPSLLHLLTLLMLCLPLPMAAQYTESGDDASARSPMMNLAGQLTSPDDVESTDTLAIKPGELPTYDALRLRTGVETELRELYVQSLPTVDRDVLTSSVVFPEIGNDQPYSRMELRSLITVAIEQNLRLINSERSIRIARSSTRSSEATFIPFLDLVGESRANYDRNENATRTETTTQTVTVPNPTGPPTQQTVTTTSQVPTTRETTTYTNRGAVESGITLPSAGQVTLNADTRRTDTTLQDGGGLDDHTRNYNSRAEIRFLQPLLRGGGTDVGTADLRRARLREMDQILADQLARRDVALSVISTYFQILQSARQIEVSRDAITERLRFLDETRTRYEVGRVDESEILRAEIQVLREMETAVDRRRQLDELRENMLILLGLPLDTPISFIDITDELMKRGRVNVPERNQAVEESLAARMELMRQDINLALSEIDTRVAVNNVLPRLDFDAGYNRNDSNTNFSEAAGFENQGWDAGLSFQLPLINIQRREAAKRSRLSLEQSRTNRLISERDLTQEVLSRLRSVLATEAQLTILSRSVEQARKSLELINGRFEVGFATVTEVRLAQDDLFESETSYSTTLLNYQIQLARLYSALGRPLF